MGLPTTAWTAATYYYLGQLVTNGGNLYQCVTAGMSGATGPTTQVANIPDGACFWSYIDNAAPTGWDSSLTNILPPAVGIAAAGFAANAQPASTLINYLLRKIDALLLWLTNMTSYALTWTGVQTFGGGLNVGGSLVLGVIARAANAAGYLTIRQVDAPIVEVIDETRAPVFILPPQPPIGKVVYLVDAGGTAATYNISIAQPGTSAIPLWTANSPYLAGDLAVNGSGTYEAITAGTSAGSGGPTGTGAGIVDGTSGLMWTFCPTIQVGALSYANGASFVAISTNFGVWKAYYRGQMGGSDVWILL